MHCDLLANNKAIGDEFADGLAGIGVGDFIDFVGIKPDLALSTACHRGSKALLGSEIDPIYKISSAIRDE